MRNKNDNGNYRPPEDRDCKINLALSAVKPPSFVKTGVFAVLLV